MSRRTDIADAAITTLATEGMRGLTHRAVDRTAGIAEGSTSYYYRTRAALVEAVLDRLVVLDTRDAPERDLSFDDFIAFLTDTLVRWSTTDRHRHLARYELILESTRRPELREPLARTTAQVHALATEMLQGIAGADAAELASALIPFIDGILFRQVTQQDPPSVPPEQIAALVRAQWELVAASSPAPRRSRRPSRG